MDKGFLSKMRKTGRRIIVLNVYQNGTIFQGPKEGGFKGIVEGGIHFLVHRK